MTEEAAQTPLETWVDRINGFLPGRKRFVTEDDLLPLVGEETSDPVLAETRAQKAALVWVRDRLSEDPSRNTLFPEKTELPWLDKLLTVARVQELAKVRIVKSGKRTGVRFDISALADTFYGRKILDGLEFSKRRSKVSREEFERIQEACARIKLALPQTVEPTTAEQFFADRGEE